MKIIDKQEEKPRIKSLDSLRGLAAATVVIAHACGTLIKGHSFDEYTPLYLLRAAHESVIFFFLLSGYVLTYQSLNQTYFSYKEFIVQRFFRIYIPYFVAITLTIGLFMVFQIYLGDKPNGLLRPLNYSVVRDHLFLAGNFDTNLYDPVIWSLVHEMRFSLIFPLILFIVSSKWLNALLIAVSFSLFANIGNIYNLNVSAGYNNSYLYTVHYCSIFILGGLLAKHYPSLKTWYSRIRSRTRVSLLLFAGFIFIYVRMIYLIPHKLGFYKLALFNEFIADWLTAVSASLFLISAIQITSTSNYLLRRFPLTLGKISYSLYLIHVPIIVILFSIFPNSNGIILMTTSIAISIMLASVINKYVEQPAASIGKRFKLNPIKATLKLGE